MGTESKEKDKKEENESIAKVKNEENKCYENGERGIEEKF